MSRESRARAAARKLAERKKSAEKSAGMGPLGKRPEASEANPDRQKQAMYNFTQANNKTIVEILEAQRVMEINMPQADAEEQRFRDSQTRTLSEMPVCAALSQIHRELPIPNDFLVTRGQVLVDGSATDNRGDTGQPELFGVNHTYWVAPAKEPLDDLIACLTTGQFVARALQKGRGERISMLQKKAIINGVSDIVYPISEELTLVCATRRQLYKYFGLMYLDARMENVFQHGSRRN